MTGVKALVKVGAIYKGQFVSCTRPLGHMVIQNAACILVPCEQQREGNRRS